MSPLDLATLGHPFTDFTGLRLAFDALPPCPAALSPKARLDNRICLPHGYHGFARKGGWGNALSSEQRFAQISQEPYTFAGAVELQASVE